jgi:acyl-coenzyme A thioesterase PaaI-like protein
MPESLQTRLLRWKFNLFPAYRGTGGRVTYLASDFSEVKVEVPLSRRTRNLVGTIFGGSLYAALDPIYMIMLMRLLGPDYLVWDKAATIRFRKPGRSTLQATFRIEAAELEAIRSATAAGDPIDRTWEVQLIDGSGVVHVTMEKVIYICLRSAHRANRIVRPE